MREVLITPEARLNEWVLTKFFNFRCNLIGVDDDIPIVLHRSTDENLHEATIDTGTNHFTSFFLTAFATENNLATSNGLGFE